MKLKKKNTMNLNQNVNQSYECVPILQKLIEIDSKNGRAIQTLKNIYATVGDTEGFSEMKALLEEVESK